jgi:hypothetical protein
MANDTNNDRIGEIENWSSWHDEYENAGSELHTRKRGVQTHVDALANEAASGPITIVSICGGRAHEVIGALENHPRRADVRGRIVELDEENSAFAREWTQKAGLGSLDVLTGDASVAESYKGLPRADIVVISGVFGHLSPADRRRTVDFLPQILRKGGHVVWTFTHTDETATNALRDYYRENGFAEEAFAPLGGKYCLTVARNHFTGEEKPFDADAKFFTFGSSREPA